MFPNRKKGLLFIGILGNFSIIILAQSYPPHRCSGKLESALEDMMRRNQMKSGNGRNNLDISPYSIYQSFYGNDQNDRLDISNSESQHKRRSHDSEVSERNTILNQKLDDTFYEAQSANNFADERNPYGNKPSLPISRVEVADLKIRLPNKARWVHVDKCQFSASNRSLDTRLIFPDLTISGKVIVHPTGGKCNMILRLRRAGIEFRTIPMDQSRNQGGSVSVRTDSHFAEPGFLSVFAHGCEGRSGIRVRQNSKRRYFNGSVPPPDNGRYPVQDQDGPFKDNLNEGSNRQEKSRYFGQYPSGNRYNDHYQQLHDRFQRRYDDGQDHFYDRDITGDYQRRKRSEKIAEIIASDDKMNFNEDILNVNDDNLKQDPDMRTFDDFFDGDGSLIFGGLKLPISTLPSGYHAGGGKRYSSHRHPPSKWYSVNENLNQQEFGGGSSSGFSPAESEEISDALTNELEQLFSVGVRGMLTTYMKKALQPAIKETLMENMGYTISYG